MSKLQEQEVEKVNDDIHEAGAFITSKINSMEEEDRKKWFKAVLGAFIGLVNLDRDTKIAIIREVSKVINHEQDPSYIG